MGEIADMMIEGVLCEGCGEFMGDGDGYPVRCSSCQADERPIKKPKSVMQNKYNCEICKKRIKKIGLQNHLEECHPELSQAVFTAMHKVLLRAKP